MAAPETEARNALIAMLAAEFAAEEFPIKDDKLHRSLGSKGTILGVYPERMVASPRDRYVSEMGLVVQFYGKYDLKVDPQQTVSPARSRGSRIASATPCEPAIQTPTRAGVWYFTLERVEYPDDPTGNKTRFEAHLTARGNNGALLSETTARPRIGDGPLS
jgi:hypothetical protein